MNGLVRGRLVVGMVTACTVTPLFDALASFHLAHPAVEISLVEDNSDRLVGRVRTGTTDLALVGASGTTPPGLNALSIVSERLVAAVAFGHPLAERRRITLAELSGYPIVCLPEGTGVRTVFDQPARPRACSPSSRCRQAAKRRRRSLFAWARHRHPLRVHGGRHHDQFKSLPIDDIETPAVLALVWTTQQSPALRGLLLHCRRFFTDQGSSRATS